MYIETERLVLRPFEAADIPALATLLRDDRIGQTYMLPDFKNEAQAAALADRLRELSLDSSRVVAGICLAGNLIGFLNDVEIQNGSIELGYVIDPAHWGRGYATEALKGVIAYLLASGFREVVAGAFAENTPSIRVMVKAGMKRLDKEDEIRYRGRVHRCVYYAADSGKCTNPPADR